MSTVKILSVYLLATALLLTSNCQQLNGHINPLWLGSEQTRDSYGTQTINVPSGLQLYYVDSAGTFRPFSTSNIVSNRQPLSVYRTGTDYDSNSRSGFFNRMDNPYRSRIN